MSVRMHPSRPPLSQDHIKLSNLPGFRSKPYYFHQQSDFLSLQIPVVKVGQPHEGSQACIKTLCSMGGRVDGFLKKQCCVRPLCKEGSHGVLLQESLHISYRGPTLLLVLTWKLGQKLKKRTVRCFAWARARARMCAQRYESITATGSHCEFAPAATDAFGHWWSRRKAAFAGGSRPVVANTQKLHLLLGWDIHGYTDIP